MQVTLVRVDTSECEDNEVQLEINDEPLSLGRGPLLKIDGTNISRNKLSLRLKDGNVVLKCLKNPAVIVDHDSTDGTQEIVEVSKVEHRIFSGDVIKFDRDRFFYKVSFGHNSDNDSVPDTSTDVEKETKVESKSTPRKESENAGADSKKRDFGEVSETEEVEANKVQKKPRKLPDWMLEGDKENIVTNKEPKDSKGKVKRSPRKTPIKKNIKDDKRQATLKESSMNEETKVKNEDYRTPNSSDEVAQPEELCETAKNIRDNSVHTETNDATDDRSQTQPDKQVKDDHVATVTDDEDGPTNIMEQKVGDVVQMESLLMDSEPMDGAGGGGMVYPVLVNPADLQDSDDDQAAAGKKLAKRKKEKKKARPPGRPKCPYGEGCYRKNPVHFQQESHPGDDDYIEEDNDSENDDRPECEYGVDCYRKNPQHKRDFKHTHRPQPKRQAKKKAAAAKKKKKKDGEDSDEYESDFIDDSEVEEDIDDTDDDENWTPPDSDKD